MGDQDLKQQIKRSNHLWRQVGPRAPPENSSSPLAKHLHLAIPWALDTAPIAFICYFDTHCPVTTDPPARLGRPQHFICWTSDYGRRFCGHWGFTHAQWPAGQPDGPPVPKSVPGGSSDRDAGFRHGYPTAGRACDLSSAFIFASPLIFRAITAYCFVHCCSEAPIGTGSGSNHGPGFITGEQSVKPPARMR
ncbi:uncharacterized protein BDV17DRAFT_6916 [Aspergillus undulatus]|uniref:uncharacterized protein n=1 Tax=Aspergillus undulatus TaxID=1810928 RepID=UPI003CCDDD1D